MYITVIPLNGIHFVYITVIPLNGIHFMYIILYHSMVSTLCTLHYKALNGIDFMYITVIPFFRGPSDQGTPLFR